jgi:hypothetical protein
MSRPFAMRLLASQWYAWPLPVVKLQTKPLASGLPAASPAPVVIMPLNFMLAARGFSDVPSVAP